MNLSFSLLQDHIAEVMSKWHSIDDEIWAKIIVLERNRRVAKAYARAPVLTVNGSDDGFDGFRDEEDTKQLDVDRLQKKPQQTPFYQRLYSTKY